MDCHSPKQGLMSASFKVRLILLNGDDSTTKKILDPNSSEAAIGSVTLVDSGLWWIILLCAYGRCFRDLSVQERVDVQIGIQRILKLCLAGGFDMFPTLLIIDGSYMIDHRMGINGHPLEIQLVKDASRQQRARSGSANDFKPSTTSKSNANNPAPKGQGSPYDLKIASYNTIQLKQAPSWLDEDCFEIGPPLFNALRGTAVEADTSSYLDYSPSAGQANQYPFRGFATTTVVRVGHLEILEFLLRAETSQPACKEAWLEASNNGHAGFVELLLGFNLIWPHVSMHTLVIVCDRGFKDVVDVLLRYGLDANSVEHVLLQSSKPPLHTNVDYTILVPHSSESSEVFFLLESLEFLKPLDSALTLGHLAMGRGALLSLASSKARKSHNIHWDLPRFI
ncbi:hypothetical protein Nepgr_031549 [Nepenthes gracilis]|uniref:Alkaline/neutral invertase n=1 Tax=Nepenthes gracilis TaxID=150966 RepID=A0AAD3TIQ2_NEPGR|nr:hypothetical protein Nepgr_031549 [Nepenthes gracilis]